MDSKESIPQAYVTWRAGKATLFLLGSYSPHRLFKIPALYSRALSILLNLLILPSQLLAAYTRKAIQFRLFFNKNKFNNKNPPKFQKVKIKTEFLSVRTVGCATSDWATHRVHNHPHPEKAHSMQVLPGQSGHWSLDHVIVGLAGDWPFKCELYAYVQMILRSIANPTL